MPQNYSLMDFRKWIMETFEQIGSDNVVFDIQPFFKRLISDPQIKEYRVEIKALHHTCWDAFKVPQRITGKTLSYSFFTFILCAYTEPVFDSPKRVSDFPFIKIQEKWIHDDDNAISRMCLQSTVDLLFGLEWFTLSNVFQQPKNPETIKQAQEMFELLRSRICFFITSEKLSVEVLNMKDEYSIEKKVGIFKPEDTSHLDYDSDDEIFRKRSKLREADLSMYDLTVGAVNSDFCFDMDTVITFFEKKIQEYDLLSEPIVLDQPALSTFRSTMFAEVERMDEDILLTARRNWLENIQVTESHLRIYQRKYNIGNVSKRQIVTNKNEALLDVGKCSSKKDLLTRTLGQNSEIMLRITTDALFCLWSNQYVDGIASELQKMIVYDCIRNVWILTYKDKRYRVDSFTHGYRMVRIFEPEKESILDRFFEGRSS